MMIVPDEKPQSGYTPVVCRICGIVITNADDSELFKALVDDHRNVVDKYMWHQKQCILSMCGPCESRTYSNETGWTQRREVYHGPIVSFKIEREGQRFWVYWEYVSYEKTEDSEIEAAIARSGTEEFEICEKSATSAGASTGKRRMKNTSKQ